MKIPVRIASFTWLGLVFVLLLQGCTTISVVTLYDNNESKSQTHILHITGSTNIAAEADMLDVNGGTGTGSGVVTNMGSTGLHDVKVTSTWAQDLLGVITFNCYKPYTVEYRNITPEMKTSTGFHGPKPAGNP